MLTVVWQPENTIRKKNARKVPGERDDADIMRDIKGCPLLLNGIVARCMKILSNAV
ncbi:MAG: hypothetical protein AMXMBFR84_15180 [Candidatus Hydrogenedentota bacterium]